MSARAQASSSIAAPFSEAESHFLRAIGIWEHDCNAPLQLAIEMNNLGGLRTTQGRYQDAMELQRKALALLQKANGSPEQEASLCANLGDTLVYAGRYADAEKTLLRSVHLLDTPGGENESHVVM